MYLKKYFLMKMLNIISAPHAPSGKVVIADEDRLNMLHKKTRLLRQQYSALGPQNQMSHGGMNHSV